ncbi:MAG: hypothetical protein RIG77_03080 [Cyclobacteriaceae bacterium]
MKFIIAGLLCWTNLLVFAQNDNRTIASPDSHAPIGVMGDHLHKKGEIMFSYRYMIMSMDGNLSGSDEISAETIVTTVPNMFAGNSNMPPTLRVVPLKMTMNMHMFGAMYAPADWITLMAMGMYTRNDMELSTYQGGSGTTVLGMFQTETKGIGDIKLGALIKLIKTEKSAMHLNFGISLPVGSITQSGEILTPMNMRPTVRVPYPMQLGSGSLDLLPGITYSGSQGKLGWGGQLTGTLRTADNGEGYKFGNQLNATGWASHRMAKWLSASVRSMFSSIGKIKNMDDEIMLPVQTAHPTFQGGQKLDLALGINMIGQTGFIANQRVAAEFALLIYQNLNGPQMKVVSTWTVGWQYAF